MARQATESDEGEAIGRTVAVEPTTSPICQRRQRGSSGGRCAGPAWCKFFCRVLVWWISSQVVLALKMQVTNSATWCGEACRIITLSRSPKTAHEGRRRGKPDGCLPSSCAWSASAAGGLFPRSGGHAWLLPLLCLLLCLLLALLVPLGPQPVGAVHCRRAGGQLAGRQQGVRRARMGG